MTSFPSDVTVYRTGVYVAVFHGRTPLCYAGTDAEAARWVWKQIEERTDLWAEMTKLERALKERSHYLSSILECEG